MNKLIYSLIFFIISAYYSASQDMNKSLIENDYPCKLLKNFSMNLDSLKYTAPVWLHGSPECVYGILDSLTDIYIESGDYRVLSTLITICNNMKEDNNYYLVDVMGSIFYGNPVPMIRFMYYYKVNYHEDLCLMKYLVSALSLQIASSDNAIKEKNVIDDEVTNLIRKKSLTNEELNYLQFIITKIDTSLWK